MQVRVLSDDGAECEGFYNVPSRFILSCVSGEICIFEKILDFHKFEKNVNKKIANIYFATFPIFLHGKDHV